MYFVVVSIFERGNFLAYELNRKGFQVILIDLGNLEFSPEDIEGPFGIFPTELENNYKNKLEDESSLINVNNGFSIWLKNSILEFNSSNIKLKSINKETLNYFKHFDIKPSDLSFDQNWLANLSHQISSPLMKDNIKGLEGNYAVPFFNPFYCRFLTRRCLVDFKKKLKDQGIQIYNSLKDIELNNKLLSLENKNFSYHSLMWTLTSYETYNLFPKLAKQMFKEVLTPKWHWVKYTVRVESEVFESFPEHFMVLEDIRLHWSYENLMILQKQVTPDSLSCWLRLPFYFDLNKYKLYSKKISQVLESKINKKIQIVEIPKISKLSAFPIYDKKNYLENSVIFDSPETWESLSINGQCTSNLKSLNLID